jgi:hypothetical protein
MAELLRRIFKKTPENAPSPVQAPKPVEHIINPVADPDRARLEAVFFTPGVVNGIVGGLDFDHRDRFGNPMRISLPSEKESGEDA